MSPDKFKTTDWTVKPLFAIYRDQVFEVGSHAKKEQLVALRAVYPNQPAHFLTWVRCENTDICEFPDLRSTCCNSPVTTYNTENHPSFHQCSWCLTATNTRVPDAKPATS